MMRSAALTLAVLVILLGLHFWQQDTSRRLLAPAVLVPFAAGFFVPWSNDMGGAAYISIALGYGLYLIRLYRSSIGKIVVQTLRYIVTSVVGLGVSVLLISWGHPLAWLRQTRGTSAYQTWYYGNTLSDRVCSVADLHWPGAAVFCLPPGQGRSAMESHPLPAASDSTTPGGQPEAEQMKGKPKNELQALLVERFCLDQLLLIGRENRTL